MPMYFLCIYFFVNTFLAGFYFNEETSFGVTFSAVFYSVLFVFFAIPMLILYSIYKPLSKHIKIDISGTVAYDIYDVCRSYIQYVLLHKWNKIDERGLEFISGDKLPKKAIKRWLVNKIISLNKGYRVSE